MSKLIDGIHESWNPIRNELFKEPLSTLLNQILPSISYQPKIEDIFNVFKMPVSDIKVVVLGVDPYPIPGIAMGYAYASPPLKTKPGVLKNIEKEVRESGQINDSDEIDLLAWVDQGILLLNTALTVQTGLAGSHLKYWEKFTTRVINHIATVNPCIWVLWGKMSYRYRIHITNSVSVRQYDRDTIKDIPYNNSYNYILSAPYPITIGEESDFFGCDHFYKVNEILKKNSKTPIIW